MTSSTVFTQFQFVPENMRFFPVVAGFLEEQN